MVESGWISRMSSYPFCLNLWFSTNTSPRCSSIAPFDRTGATEIPWTKDTAAAPLAGAGASCLPSNRPCGCSL